MTVNEVIKIEVQDTKCECGTDRYAAYNYFNSDNRQVCWSHLSRDFERFAHSSYAEVKYLGEYLSGIKSELFALKKHIQRVD